MGHQDAEYQLPSGKGVTLGGIYLMDGDDGIQHFDTKTFQWSKLPPMPTLRNNAQGLTLKILFLLISEMAEATDYQHRT